MSRTKTELACLKSARTTLIARPVPHYAHEQAEGVQMRWQSIRSAALIMVTCAPVVSILIFAIVGGN